MHGYRALFQGEWTAKFSENLVIVYFNTLIYINEKTIEIRLIPSWLEIAKYRSIHGSYMKNIFFQICNPWLNKYRFKYGINSSNLHRRHQIESYALYNNNHHHQVLIADTMGSANIKAQIITKNKHKHLYYFKWKAQLFVAGQIMFPILRKYKKYHGGEQQWKKCNSSSLEIFGPFFSFPFFPFESITIHHGIKAKRKSLEKIPRVMSAVLYF